RDPPFHGRAGLRRRLDAEPDEGHTRRRSRLSRPGAAPAGALLRTAAVAADLQADPDGGRGRPLLPDRDLLPGRGPPRRPPIRVPTARPRALVPDARRGLGHARGRGRRLVRGAPAPAPGPAVPPRPL